jgi:PGF-CTERM protein
MHKTLVIAVAVLAVSVTATTAVTAQEINRDIEFEDNVTVGEETTITYVSVIEQTPVEDTVDIDLTLFVDGEEVSTATTQEEIFNGAEIRVNFTHTFESAGEKQVRVETLSEVLGQEVEGSAESTVTVSGGEMEEETNETDGEMDEGTDEEMDGENETDEEMDEGTDGEMEDGNETEETENETDDESGGEGLPGFTAVVALVSLVAGAAYVRKRS